MTRLVRSVAAFLIAYVASRLIFVAFGFRYAPLLDGFDIRRLVIDLVVFLTLLVAADWALRRLFGTRERPRA